MPSASKDLRMLQLRGKIERKKLRGAGEIAQWLRAPPTELDNLKSISGIHKVEGEKPSPGSYLLELSALIHNIIRKDFLSSMLEVRD